MIKSTMNTDPIHNSPHASLWQSAAAEVAARKMGNVKATAPEVQQHPLVKAAAAYSSHLMSGKAVKRPAKGTKAGDPQLQAYLSFIHHKAAHAIIAGDKALEAQVAREREQFVFGQPEWEEQMVYYFWYYFQYPLHMGQAPLYRSWKDKRYGKSRTSYGVIDWKIPAKATVALIGDIGIGTDTAAAVLAGALSHDPDVVLHVGDVYYSGTKFEFEHRLSAMYQEVCKALKKKVPMFTIPGNHEYFNGNQGFFACLDSSRLVCKDSQRQEASFFCLRSADAGWQFLAMDTGFHGHYLDVPMSAQQAALSLLHNKQVHIPTDPTDKEWPKGFNPHFRNCKEAHLKVADMDKHPAMIAIRKDELAWHEQQLKAFKGRTVLLSHHQVLSANQKVGVEQRMVTRGGKRVPDPKDVSRPGINTALWAQFGPHMDKVAAWFWGHEHNLVVFPDNYVPAAWVGSTGANAKTFKPIPKARCIGHSAVPVQQKEKPYADKFDVPLDAAAPQLSVDAGFYSRGYQVLQLAGKGKPATLDYYQVSEKDLSINKIFSEQIS